MNYRRFGQTGMTVSEVGFGCARLGGVFEQASRADMVRTLRRSLEQGITFYDTSDMYCQGESEALLGDAFHGERQHVIIASKVGYCLPARRQFAARIKPLLRPVIQRIGLKRQQLPAGLRGELSQDFSAGHLRAAIEGTLRRLRTDYLDIYLLHSPPPEILEEGAFVAPLEQLKREGKIRHFGVSCERAEDADICLRYRGITALQLRLNLLDRQPVEGVLARVAAQGIGVIARECLGGGLLAREDGVAAPDEPTLEAELKRMRRLAERGGRSLAELALQFVLSRREVSVALLGMRSAAHLMENLQAAASPRLTTAELGALTGIA